MFFDHLLFESLVPGKTLAEDREHGCHTSAVLRPMGDETILLFRIDGDRTRKQLGLAGRRCCDNLYFVKDMNHSLLVLVELKSSDPGKAKQQILDTFAAIHSRCEHVKNQSCKVYAVIVTSHGSPRNLLEMKRELREKGIQLEHGSSKGKAFDLRSVLKNR